MRNYFLPATAFAAALFFVSCQHNGKGGAGEDSDTAVSATTIKPAEITLGDVSASPDFPDAQLSMVAATAAKQGADSTKVSFDFLVKGYELKSNTGDADHKLCSNSDKGQHIHFILDNQPYVALYEPKHDATVANNTEHYLLCFLSRSYHESIKSKGAALLLHFKVDDKGTMKMLDAKEPMLFYSRPKGEYIGKDTANILLDFYVINAVLGADYKVKAAIKNETTGAAASFTLNEWKPKFIEHLGLGKCSVTLTLLGKDGEPASGPNTTVTRSFTLAAGEPVK